MIKQLAESDFAAQARTQAMAMGQNIQVGARGAADSFNRFVEGPEYAARQEPERKDFWDHFSSLASQQDSSHNRSTSRGSAIGTAAMKGPPSSSTGTGANTSSTGTAKGQDDGWDDNW